MAASDKGAAAAAPAAPVPLLKAIVARGRTIMQGGRHHRPGDVLELSPDEHGFLLSRGFIVDHRVTPPSRSDLVRKA